jgi:hypothetical protein
MRTADPSMQARRAIQRVADRSVRGPLPGRSAEATGHPSDVVTVATINVGHLARFVDARDWRAIVP